MYRHTITIEIQDSIVHHHSIQEWEDIFLHAGVIQRDELPLSYGRIAEILAEEYHKYGQPYFDHAYDSGANSSDIMEITNTEFVNEHGHTISTRLVPATPAQLAKTAAALMAVPEERNTMQIGIIQY